MICKLILTTYTCTPHQRHIIMSLEILGDMQMFVNWIASLREYHEPPGAESRQLCAFQRRFWNIASDCEKQKESYCGRQIGMMPGLVYTEEEILKHTEAYKTLQIELYQFCAQSGLPTPLTKIHDNAPFPTEEELFASFKK